MQLGMNGRALTVTFVVATATVVGCQQLVSKGDPATDGAPQGDATAYLQSRIDALHPGDTLKLDIATYSHGGVIKIQTPGIRIDGNGATLQATNDATSSIQILADNVELTNITLAAPPTGPRMDNLDQQKLVIAGNHDTISSVNISGSAAAGVFVNGAQNFTIKNVNVANTRADGVHVTASAGYGVVDNVRTDHTGDDGIAVVSYSDGPPCHDIVESNLVVASSAARGIAVVGGTNVTVRDFTSSDSGAAGIYIATEGAPYFTRSVDHVNVSNGSISTANRDATIVHGAILITADNPGTTISGVTISDVNIAGTAQVAERNVAVLDDGGAVKDVTLSSIRVDSSALPALVGDIDPGKVKATGWTVAGVRTSVN